MNIETKSGIGHKDVTNIADILAEPANNSAMEEKVTPVGKIGDSEFVCVMGEEENRYPVPRNLTYPVNH
ncbi:MAG: hypothetical protein Q7J54_05490 [Candidatus Woesearchaeota archaeon]|nr:hypothetical protein [Candidatus Woesearchaeota archaeon]